MSSEFLHRTFKVGTRNSPLALIQTKQVIEQLKLKTGNFEFEILTPEDIKVKLRRRELLTKGHRSYNKLSKLALSLNELDFIVHSMKDVSTSLTSEFVIGCVCLRDSCEDVVILRKDLKEKSLEELPPGSVIGTSSSRRMSMMKRKYPQHEIISIKGDLDKRIQKLDNPNLELIDGGETYSAIVVAKAGIVRLNLQDRISQELKSDDGYYTVGQGALACECRTTDENTLKLLSSINDERAMLSCIAERSLMISLSCKASEAIAVQSIYKESKLTLKARVSNSDGSKFLEKENTINLLNNKDENESMETLESKIFAGITVFKSNKAVLSNMLACENLGKNVAEILKTFKVDAILLENRNEKKLSRHRKR